MSVLCIGKFPGITTAKADFGARWAASEEEARRLYAALRPDIICVGTSGWAPPWVLSLPPEERPSVVVVGDVGASVPFGDEWLPSLDSAPDLSVRLRIALQRGRERRRLARRAMTDALTGLPNRRAAIRRLIRATARAKRDASDVSIVLADLDHFKRVNDAYGHDAGDRLLRRVGLALARVVRRDELCARIGGDEFAMILDGGLASARRAAKRLRAALGEESVSATFAVGQWKSGERLRDLYRRTDGILKAKKARRITVARASANDTAA